VRVPVVVVVRIAAADVTGWHRAVALGDAGSSQRRTLTTATATELATVAHLDIRGLTVMPGTIEPAAFNAIVVRLDAKLGPGAAPGAVGGAPTCGAPLGRPGA
jgi:hypothetical protein